MDYNAATEEVDNFLEYKNRYRTVFQKSAVAIMITDQNEKIIDCNKFTEELLETNKEELLNTPIEELYPKHEWEKIRNQNIRMKGIQHHLETKIKRKNDEPLDVDISISVLRNLKGEITGSIGVIRDISERKQAEERLQSVLENAIDSIYMLDKNLVYLTVNNELLKRLNLNENQVVGHSFDELHSEQETKDFRNKVEWVFNNGKPTKDEHKCTNLGQWFLRTLSPVKDSLTGETIAVAVISKDITDLKKAEHDLKISEEKYRTIFDNSAVAIMLTDANENIVSWNKFTETMLDMNKNDLHKKPVEELYPEDEWQKIRKQNIRKKGMQHHLETKIIRKNDEPLDVDISVSILKDHSGKITGSIGVIKDISKRKKAEEKMKYEHSLLQSLLDNVPDSIYFKDIGNRFVLVNKAKADHHNTTPEKMIGKTDFDYQTEKRAKKSFEADKKVLQTETPIINEIERYKTPEGGEKWVSVTKIPRYNNDGELIGTMGVSRDVTKHMRETKETEKYKKVAIGQNMRMVELRDKVKDLIQEMEQKEK